VHPWERFLGRVSCPGQYIGGELNGPRIAAARDSSSFVRICICFPDKYSVGMSNLGLEIIVKQLNTIPGVVCERAFAPDVDMEAEMRRCGEVLRSLDTATPLRDFHVLGFSLQTELGFSNVLTMLDLAGIPLRANQRTGTFPLVAAGGPSAANPAVMARFIDFFVIGEAEPLLSGITAAIAPFFGSGVSGEEHRKNVLRSLARLPGVYVPGINDRAPIEPGVADLKTAYFPMEPTVPIVRTAHQRLNVEISRGCAHRCAYCQAGHTYQPMRIRPREIVLEAVERGLAATGYDEVALTGFCVTAYPDLPGILREIKRRHRRERVSVSLPSLRVDDITEELAAELSEPRRASITIAPEAGTEQLRARIGKRFSDRLLYEKLALLHRHGFRKVKLYFMLGLPGETDEDVAAIPTMVRALKRLLPGMSFGITASPFVPRPHTPFQYAAMCTPAILATRLEYLQKHLGRDLKRTSIKESVLEAFLARGDERVGAIVESAWAAGARFDAWSEHFQPGLWFSILKADPGLLEQTVFNERSADEAFPWGMLSFGRDSASLYRIYSAAMQPRTSTEPTPWGSWEVLRGGVVPPPQAEARPSLAPVTLRFRFSRRGSVRYLSHLDQIEIIRRALRSSGLPLEYSHGYNPQIKVAFGPPVPVGWESDTEYADVEVSRLPDLRQVCDSVSRMLPVGMMVQAAGVAPAHAEALSALVNMMTCEVEMPKPADSERLQTFLSAESFPLSQRTKSGVRTLDGRAMVRSMSIIGESRVRITIRVLPGASVRPETIVAGVFELTEEERACCVVRRTALHVETPAGLVVDVS